VLAWAGGASGEWYVGTNLALHLPDETGNHRRLGWEEVERADWQRDSDRLAIVEVADWGTPERTTVVRVDEPGHLLELLRERVTKSVACSLHSPVRGTAGLNVVGRRGSPGWTRTINNSVNSRVLCQLSYRGSKAVTILGRAPKHVQLAARGAG
jgi:hypothetical protein